MNEKNLTHFDASGSAVMLDVSEKPVTLVEATIEPTRKALADSGLSVGEIDKILLVGGSSRIPAVQEAIKRVLGKEPTKNVNPDECVAVGAAIQGGVLVGEVKELKYVKDIVVETAELVKKEKGSDMEYHIGTMIEIPRAALTADAIATEAEFFSFGTNDLTQMTFGFSRDDAGKFLGAYYEKKIYEQDPFARLDQVGVGQLVKMAAEKGKATRPNIKLGICGEHGGDPSSVEFCHNIGLTYVSCSPYRVPIARLAAAQAAIKASK